MRESPRPATSRAKSCSATNSPLGRRRRAPAGDDVQPLTDSIARFQREDIPEGAAGLARPPVDRHRARGPQPLMIIRRRCLAAAADAGATGCEAARTSTARSVGAQPPRLAVATTRGPSLSAIGGRCQRALPPVGARGVTVPGPRPSPSIWIGSDRVARIGTPADRWST
jgi:hypothetical protein